MDQETDGMRVKDGDRCTVIKGAHAGQSGIARDIHTSRTGSVTLTVGQANGERFKTLATNVKVTSGGKHSGGEPAR